MVILHCAWFLSLNKFYGGQFGNIYLGIYPTDMLMYVENYIDARLFRYSGVRANIWNQLKGPRGCVCIHSGHVHVVE